MVLGGTQWTEQQLRPIDAYLGAADGCCSPSRACGFRQHNPSAPSRSAHRRCSTLISFYGVRVGRDMVLDTACRDYRLPQQQPGGQVAWEDIGTYSAVVSISPLVFRPPTPITASFRGSTCCGPVACPPRSGRGSALRRW